MMMGIFLPTLTVYNLPLTSKKGEYYYLDEDMIGGAKILGLRDISWEDFANDSLGTMENKICISGRSIGDVNVQIILEKLGGGGHITLAGAQLEGMTLEEAKTELIIRINEYFTEI